MSVKIFNEELRAIYQEMQDLPDDGLSTATALARIAEAVKTLAFHVDRLTEFTEKVSP